MLLCYFSFVCSKATVLCLVGLSESRVCPGIWKYLENSMSSSSKGPKWILLRSVGLVCFITVTLIWGDLIHSLGQFANQTGSMLSPKEGTGQGFRWFKQPCWRVGRASYKLWVRKLCGWWVLSVCGFLGVFWWDSSLSEGAQLTYY